MRSGGVLLLEPTHQVHADCRSHPQLASLVREGKLERLKRAARVRPVLIRVKKEVLAIDSLRNMVEAAHFALGEHPACIAQCRQRRRRVNAPVNDLASLPLQAR